MYGRAFRRVQAMVASVLPTLTGGAPMLSQTLRIDRGERGDVPDRSAPWPQILRTCPLGLSVQR
jgi:hypothetical protein